MFKKIPISIFYWCIIVSFCLSKQIQAEDSQSAYANHEWNCQINVPPGWHCIEGKQIVQKIKDLGRDSHELVEKSGVIVNISEYPFGSKVDFNPNINISAKNIVITSQPATERQIVEYAKKVLLSLVPSGSISDIQQGKVNDLISISSEYEYQLQASQGTVNISNLSTILVSKTTNNYFIIIATCKKQEEEKYFPIFKTEIASFKEIADD